MLASLAIPGVARAADGATSDVAIKAAFLFNFAKFTEWPTLATDAALMLCVVGDLRVAGALADTVRNQRIGSHAVEARTLGGDAPARSCHVLFLSMSEAHRSAAILDGLGTLPILTVSDAKDFARSRGVVEIFVENGRMRFCINTDAADRAGLHLSSRLLGLAKVIRDEHAHP
jgi:YfiR/HmsC-like